MSLEKAYSPKKPRNPSEISLEQISFNNAASFLSSNRSPEMELG
jgi:hypothetical protein